MASETITRNDLTAILNEVLPPTPSEYKKLLWTNPNPTANFPTQALLSGEDLTVYDAIEVIGINYGGYKSIMPPLQIPIGGKGNLIGLAGSTGDSAGMGFMVMRGISANSNGIVVNGAMGVSTNGSSWSANDNNMIPQKIYGIKYERVAPPQVEYPNYSTDEQEVGTWVDGKTIYRKVYLGLNFGGTANAWTDTGATITGVNTLVSCRALNLSGVIQTLMGFRIYNNKIQYHCAQTWSGTTCIIIEYTKN